MVIGFTVGAVKGCVISIELIDILYLISMMMAQLWRCGGGEQVTLSMKPAYCLPVKRFLVINYNKEFLRGLFMTKDERNM